MLGDSESKLLTGFRVDRPDLLSLLGYLVVVDALENAVLALPAGLAHLSRLSQVHSTAYTVLKRRLYSLVTLDAGTETSQSVSCWRHETFQLVRSLCVRSASLDDPQDPLDSGESRQLEMDRKTTIMQAWPRMTNLVSLSIPPMTLGPMRTLGIYYTYVADLNRLVRMDCQSDNYRIVDVLALLPALRRVVLDFTGFKLLTNSGAFSQKGKPRYWVRAGDFEIPARDVREVEFVHRGWPKPGVTMSWHPWEVGRSFPGAERVAVKSWQGYAGGGLAQWIPQLAQLSSLREAHIFSGTSRHYNSVPDSIEQLIERTTDAARALAGLVDVPRPPSAKDLSVPVGGKAKSAKTFRTLVFGQKLRGSRGWSEIMEKDQSEDKSSDDQGEWYVATAWVEKDCDGEQVIRVEGCWRRAAPKMRWEIP